MAFIDGHTIVIERYGVLYDQDEMIVVDKARVTTPLARSFGKPPYRV